MKRYKRAKIKILKELGVSLSEQDLRHLDSLSNEIQVDNFAHSLIFRGDD